MCIGLCPGSTKRLAVRTRSLLELLHSEDFLRRPGLFELGVLVRFVPSIFPFLWRGLVLGFAFFLVLTNRQYIESVVTGQVPVTLKGNNTSVGKKIDEKQSAHHNLNTSYNLRQEQTKVRSACVCTRCIRTLLSSCCGRGRTMRTAARTAVVRECVHAQFVVFIGISMLL